MSTKSLLIDTATRLFTDFCDKPAQDAAETGAWPDVLLDRLAEYGLLEIGMTESGLTIDEAFAVLEVAGRFAVPLPLAEFVLANRWLGRSRERVSIGLAIAGGADAVPWGRAVERVLAVTPADGLELLTPASVGEARNLAGEPRDTVSAERRERLEVDEPVYALLCLSRIVMMAGALDRVLELSIQYASEREQFGRSISKFQAIQHYLAQMAAQTAAAGRAADAAVDAAARMLERNDPALRQRFLLEVAAAKARVGEAVDAVVEPAHQIHGAMGYTHEHQLHHYTRRLWAWRDEYGGERYWQRLLGERVAALGADGLWDFIATRG